MEEIYGCSGCPHEGGASICEYCVDSKYNTGRQTQMEETNGQFI